MKYTFSFSLTDIAHVDDREFPRYFEATFDTETTEKAMDYAKYFARGDYKYNIIFVSPSH
jgi:hypothetical protein